MGKALLNVPIDLTNLILSTQGGSGVIALSKAIERDLTQLSGAPFKLSPIDAVQFDRFDIESAGEKVGAGVVNMAEVVTGVAGLTKAATSTLARQGSKVVDDVVESVGQNKVESFSSNAAFDGKLYSDKKITQLVQYLDKREISVWGTKGNPKFVGKWDGTGELHLPVNPTELQVKHELSHYLDFKNQIKKAATRHEGVQNFIDMGRFGREQSVLDRLQNNRVWDQLNDAERSFSIDYVERLKIETGQ